MNNSLKARSIFNLGKATPGLLESRESCLPGRVMPRLSAAPGRAGAFLPCVGDSLRARAGWVWRAVAGLLLLLATLAPAQAQAQAQAQTGICGRTAAVQTAILAKISGITDCANVTTTHLAAITGTLDLNNSNITALAAGDFAGLTSLSELWLHKNNLTEIPSGVFDDLTSLVKLLLYEDTLTALPAGVFDELTSLDWLDIEDNRLTTLPAGVFEPLTSLTRLFLRGNPGSPFRPAPVALPDDGTVFNTGGTVTLDGSGSSGAWGTNVTSYSWALTSPASGVTVTFDDDASATPTVTIPALVTGTELTFTLTVIGGAATSRFDGMESGTDTATVTVVTAAATGAPENLRVVAGNAEVTLRWDAPNDDGGADITGYAYRYKESGGDLTAYTDIPESGPDQTNARSYTVTELTNGLEYTFGVRAVNEHGGGLPAEVTVTLPGRVHTESEELPTEVALWGNYPNPFNPETTIRYALPQAGNVRLAVYDLLGHEVAVLVDGLQPAGRHTVRFGASDLPSGSYVYRLQAGDKIVTRSMMLVK